MSIFDSPIARCEAVREMVLTDDTQAECAREHKCLPEMVCPLKGYFVEPDASGRCHPDTTAPRH